MPPTAKNVTKEWILPASIPFADLKARDLEECARLDDALAGATQVLRAALDAIRVERSKRR